MKFMDDKEKASSFLIAFQYCSAHVKTPVNLVQTLDSTCISAVSQATLMG
jgi:hypothetical protein